MSTPIAATHKLSELLDDQHYWGSYVLYGESIPHLLHWDWAYLWVLDRQSTIPLGWQARVEAWRRLLCMLLLGELELDVRAIEQPLLSYTEKASFDQLVFVRARSLFPDFPIGVFSPTVFVRPLPEPNRFELSAEKLVERLPKHYSPPPTISDRRAELLQSLELLKKAIQGCGSQLSATLLRLIERHLPAAEFPRIHGIYPVAPLPSKARLVVRADASAWEELRFVNIPVLVPQGRLPTNQFVPKCQRCAAVLTYAPAEPAVDASVNVALRCRCGAITPFEYSDFGIWKHGDTFFVWRELEQLEGLGQHAVPPGPIVSEDEVCFTWNPALIGGEVVRSHVRLRFGQHQIRAVGISEIKYNILLIPGDFDEDFKGLPVRPEWMFAVDQLPETDITGGVITFRNLKLRGLRHTVTLARYPRAACRVAPDFQVGMFPAPMYEGWRRYRFFWSDGDGDQYRACIVPDRGQPAVEKRESIGATDWHDELPDALSIEATNQRGMPPPIGATWLLQKARKATLSQPVYIGVDFGTTSSVVYAERQDSHPVVLELGDFARTAKILCGNGDPRTTFLPPTEAADAAGLDPTLIPSALWFAPEGEFNPIRWSRRGPTSAHSARYGFKWDLENEPLRKRYFEELLFLVLPTALNKLFPGNAPKGNWNIGFAFPLAFSSPHRKAYANLFTELRQRIDKYSSGPVELKSINESYACVRAFGEHLHGSVFLIADLGGGSLDVALFEIVSSPEGRPITHHFQVGSAKIGGEVFVNALARGMGADDEARLRHYWNIRYAIMTGRVAQELPGVHFGAVATRFLPIAQELLRIMVEAFRTAFPDKKVELVLVGNGWRIAEFTAAVPLAQSLGRQELEKSFQEFEVPNVSPYPGELEVPIKHVVALGALKNAKPGGRNDIEEPHEAKMPAGRDLKLRNTGETIHWFDLVGSAVRNLPLGTAAGHIEIYRSSGPQPATQWLRRLSFAAPRLDSNPSDAYVRDRLEISGERLERGPLQIILEKNAEDLS